MVTLKDCLIEEQVSPLTVSNVSPRMRERVFVDKGELVRDRASYYHVTGVINGLVIVSVYKDSKCTELLWSYDPLSKYPGLPMPCNSMIPFERHENDQELAVAA